MGQLLAAGASSAAGSAAGQTALQSVASKVGTTAATSAATNTAMGEVLGKVGASSSGVLPKGSAIGAAASAAGPGKGPAGKQLVGNDLLKGLKAIGKKQALGGGMLKPPGVKDRQAKQDALQETTGVSDMLAEALSGGINAGSVTRLVGDQLPAGSPVGNFIKQFGNAFDPISGSFRADALFDKDVNKYLGEQRKHLTDIMDGEPGQRPIDTIVNAFMTVLGGSKNG